MSDDSPRMPDADPLANAPVELLDLAWMCLAGTEPVRAATLLGTRLDRFPDAPWTYPGIIAAGHALANALSAHPADAPDQAAATALLERFWTAAPDFFEAEVSRFDPRSDGLVRWPDAPEPFALDAAVLLLEDARLFLKLVKSRENLLPQANFARATLNDAEDWLVRTLWDDDGMQFLRLDGPDVDPCVDLSARPLWILEWKSARQDMLDAALAIRPLAAADARDPAAVPLRLLLAARLVRSGASEDAQPSSPASAAPRYRRVAAQLLALPIPTDTAPERAAVHESIRHALCAHVPAASDWSRPVPRTRLLAFAVAAVVLLLLVAACMMAFRSSRAGTPLSLLQRARQALDDGDPATAAELYQTAADAAESPSDRIRLLTRRANCLFHADRPQEAESAYRALLAATPDLPSVRYDLACALWAQRRTNEAIQTFRDLPDLAPSATSDLRARAARAADYLSSLPQ
ncbi:MAG: tetratricopeptide repeat protein [Kiritimatiellae bacterium]|nr:tetratricopeptide repeat protein [Kiritimatiellia bacterium]